MVWNRCTGGGGMKKEYVQEVWRSMGREAKREERRKVGGKGVSGGVEKDVTGIGALLEKDVTVEGKSKMGWGSDDHG